MFAYRRILLSAIVAALASVPVAACSNEPPPPQPKVAVPPPAPKEAVVEEAKQFEASAPYRAKLATTRGAEIYLPTWFAPRRGGYDLIVHFHGLGKLQEANIEHAQLNVAVVSVNLGVGSDPYGNVYRDPATFQKLLAEAQEEIDKSGRAHGATLRRLALSAWSAGESSVARVLDDPEVEKRVDAVLLADGLFTTYTGDPRRKVINAGPLEKFARLVASAQSGDKLFAITHTAIPTSGYPSMTEVVGKLLEMTSSEKVPSRIVGPKNMHEIYVVDRGSFHVKSYEGVLAGDHIKQITAMGETLYPYLRDRWSAQDAAASPVASKQAAR